MTHLLLAIVAVTVLYFVLCTVVFLHNRKEQ
jgi:preprotein translocase subunit SecG